MTGTGKDNVRVHHLLPGVTLIELGPIRHRWIAYHNSLGFYSQTAPGAKRDSSRLRLLRPGELYVGERDGSPALHKVLHVGEETFGRIVGELGVGHSGRSPLPSCAREAQIGEALSALEESICDGSEGRCVCYTRLGHHARNLVNLATAVIEAVPDSDPQHGLSGVPAQVRRARSFLAGESSDPYAVGALAKAAGTQNPYYLLTQFRRAVGISPGQFRRSVLVEKMREALLSAPVLPLEALALHYGWPSREDGQRHANTMIDHFRKCYSVTPHRYRRDLRHAPADWHVWASDALDRALRERTGAKTSCSKTLS